jgi:hypothetical protein
LAQYPESVRVGPVGENAYTERLAQALATGNDGGLAVGRLLVANLRASRRAEFAGLPVRYVATLGKGPDLLVGYGKGEDPTLWKGLAVEHKRLGGSHARRRSDFQQLNPAGHDGHPGSDTASCAYDFSKLEEVRTSSGDPGMWQLDAARCYPTSWLPVDGRTMPVRGWLFVDARGRDVSSAFSFTTDIPRRPPQTLVEWDCLEYDQLSNELIVAFRRLNERGDRSGAATILPLIQTLYLF